MTAAREEFEAWFSDGLPAPLRRNGEEYVFVAVQSAWDAWQAAHLAGQRAMQERATEACFDHHFDRWALYKGLAPYTGDEPGRADSFVSGESTGAETCEEIIRALEVKPS